VSRKDLWVGHRLLEVSRKVFWVRHRLLEVRLQVLWVSRGHVSAFSYMARQAINSGLVAISYMVRQAQSRILPFLGTQDKQTVT